MGASGHGKVVADVAREAGWERVVFFDDRWPDLQCSGDWMVVGRFIDALQGAVSLDALIVAVGDARMRKRWLRSGIDQGMKLATLVHPRACVSRSARLGAGVVVVAGAVVNVASVVGDGAIVNTGATLDHDCELGEVAHLCPGSHVAGNVAIGEGAWVGIGASVKQGVRIGAWSTVGAGAAVIGDVDDHSTVVGVPARPLAAHSRGAGS
jgi:sugar O-acyltransferase (sialic acid O-acetyltransferase NeuD family)